MNKNKFVYLLLIVMFSTSCGLSTEKIVDRTVDSETITATPLTVLSTSTATETATYTPSPSPTQTLTPTPTSTLTPTAPPTPLGGGAGRIVFDLPRNGQGFPWSSMSTKVFETIFPALSGERNVFVADLDGENITPLTDGLQGYNIVEDVSPNGQQILVSSVSHLYSLYQYGDLYVMDIDGTNSIKITNRFLRFWKSAHWLSDGSKIVFIAQEGDENAIFIINPDGTDLVRITKDNALPSMLIPTIDNTAIYWEASCDHVNLNCGAGYKKTNIDTLEEQEIWKGISITQAARQGDSIIYYNSDMYFLSDLDLSITTTLSTSPPIIPCSSCIFLSPDGRNILYLGSPPDGLYRFTSPDAPAIPIIFEPVYDLTWSPDNRLVLVWSQGLPPKVIDLETKAMVFTLPDNSMFDNLSMANNVVWLPFER